MLWNYPRDHVLATLVLAHGAGAPMDSPFMEQIARALAEQGIVVARFEFSYMAQRRLDGRKRPPAPTARLLDTWRTVIEQVKAEGHRSFAIGGKSMGGRMASLLADECQVQALVCLGYPFYPAGRPEKPRVEHLAVLQTPTLIMQGERDALGNRETVETYTLSPAIKIDWVPTANHDLKPLKSTGQTHDKIIESSAARIACFLKE
nr:alpha/beta family hydrolase [Pseudomonas duriflava]